MRKILIALIFVGCVLTTKAEDKTQSTPLLTEVEQLRLENTELRIASLIQQIDALREKFSAQQKQIEAEHPGYFLDVNTLQLVKILPKK